ncbi:MAG: aminotransferase class I/II-fold pyridoxal phosphate-dependent enzyme [Deltaproteobacteria bacterium]|nr:MAG: aminotransferase class I/II-fold pyridoxal phosphate-dependent enzyme [Deltaproteobacteria bacterium]
MSDSPSRHGDRPASPIAIIGMGARFAGAHDLHAYWRMTAEGRHGFSGIPKDRWDHEAFYDPNPRRADRSTIPGGAFIEDVRSFPAIALGIPPRRVEVMDPQQRFALEVSLQALEDAGLAVDDLPRRTGVFMGVTANEYKTLSGSRLVAQLMANGALGEVDPADVEAIGRAVSRVVSARPFSAPGLLNNMISAIVAQELNLHGPAYSVDSACSSALVAVYDAVQHLRSGALDVALAGGVYVCLTPEHHIAFSRIGAMSRSGTCLPFDTRADGFLQGDGAGAVILKRLDDALADGDRIAAVIHGAFTNNDGGTDGPMAPIREGQVEVVSGAWENAGLDPASLGYVECHGTGTQVGDVIEVDGLHEALGQHASDVVLGSSKANVGHTMSAAGIAGLLRAALSIERGVRPPMAGFESAKPDLRLDERPFRIPTAAEPWDAENRVAGVSAFGFGGTNAHVVLASPPRRPAPAADPRREAIRLEGRPAPELLLLSAPDTDALRRLAADTADALEDQPDTSLTAAARALARRRLQPARAAIVAATLDEAVRRLRAVSTGEQDDLVVAGTADEQPPRVAFLFPGQGAQRVGMLRDIRRRFPRTEAVLAAVERSLEGRLSRPLRALLDPGTPDDEAALEAANAELTRTENAQPALFGVGAALAALLDEVGVTPVVCAGHSVGEFTAAVAAGALSVEDGARFTAARGAAMAAVQGDPGTMAAILAPREQVEALLVPGAMIANINHPRQFVVSGTTEAVREVARRAEEKDIRAVLLNVSHGFHSQVFADVDLTDAVEALALSAPLVPLASCIDDHPHEGPEHTRAIFARHAASPVDFAGALEQCRELGATLWLQVGAGGPLHSFVRGALGESPTRIVTLAADDDRDGGASLLRGLGALWVHGVDLDTEPLLAGSERHASLPPTRLPREPYWSVRDTTEGVNALTIQGSPAVRAQQHAEPVAALQTAASAAAPSADDQTDPLEEGLLDAVARVSAYPRDAVRIEMRLVEDLGFDSMMVSDLGEELMKLVPGMKGIPRELFVNSPTIQDILTFARGGGGDAGGEDIDDDAPLARAVPGWHTATRPAADLRTLAGRHAVVIGVQDGIADALRAALRDAGARVLEETEPSALAAKVDLVVLHVSNGRVAPLSDFLASGTALPAPEAPLLALADALGMAGREADVMALWRDGDPFHGGATSAVRTLGREWPGRICRNLCIGDGLSPVEIAAQTLAEWASVDRSPDVRLAPGARQVRALVPERAPARPERLLRASDVVLVTGGTRGIGAKLAAEIAPSGATVLLLGRGAPSEEAAALIAARPGRVHHVAADVTDAAALQAALAPHPAVTVLVHAAGVLADGPLGEVPAERAALARAVKVEGWVNALRAAGPGLEVALGVGSWAGRFGNRHQLHYSAANGLLASLSGAVGRARLAVSEFGPWTTSEMAQSIPEVIRATMRQEGVDFVGDRAGMDALVADLAHGEGICVRGRRLPLVVTASAAETTLDVETHPYLADHAIEGTPIEPMAMAADRLARAALAGVPAPFVLEGLELFEGITVKTPAKLRVTAEQGRAELRHADRDRLAWKARVAALEAPPETAFEVPEGGEAPTLSLAEFYDGLTFHGPLLQGIRSIERVGEDFVVGRVRTGQPAEWFAGAPAPEAWVIDPLAFDSAMQLAAYVAWIRYRRAGTPFACARFEQHRPWPAGELRAAVRFGERSADRFTADIAFLAEDGALIALASGVSAELRAVAGEEAESSVAVDAAEAPAEFEVKPEWVDFGAMQEVQELEMRLNMAEAFGLKNPYFDLHDGTARNTTLIDGRPHINFSSYNYLGLSGDPRVVKAATEAMEQFGTSVSASRIASGERPFHRELEAELAAAHGCEDAIVFTSGHATNVTTVGHLFGAKDLILHDELIHDSMLQGIKLSGAARRGFRHDDAAHLEQQLKALRHNYEKVLIVIEGVYSMDGDIADLPKFVALKERYGALLMVDEAHSFGTVGARGRGVHEHFGYADASCADLWMGTMSKSLASVGGWIAGKASVIRYLRYTAPGFVYSAGLPPAQGVAALTSLRLMLEEPERPQQLQRNAAFFCGLLQEKGLDTGPARGESPVVPVITGDSLQALQLSDRLLARGINAKPIVYPAVANDAARLRCFLSSTHTEAELAEAATAFAEELAAVRAG